MSHIQTMTNAYIEAIYFTDTGDDGQPEASADLTPLTRMQAYLDCRSFYQAVTKDLGINAGHIDWRQAGHDLWLTRNRCGTGFWDRDQAVYGVLENGTELKTIYTAMATAMGGHDAEFQE